MLWPSGRHIGASRLRMAFEVCGDLLGRAGERQLADRKFGRTHDLGGAPFNSVAAISIFGRFG